MTDNQAQPQDARSHVWMMEYRRLRDSFANASSELDALRGNHRDDGRWQRVWDRMDEARHRLDAYVQGAPVQDASERDALRKALRPFARFAEVWDRGTRGLHDELYAIHHTKGRAVLRLSDCERAFELLRTPSATPEVEP